MRHAPALVSTSLVLATVIAASLASQEKRPLNHDDYDKWPSIRSTTYSPDGKWMAYSVDPAFGDGVLYVRQVDGNKVHKYPLGSGPRFSADGKKVVFSVRKSAEKEYRKKLDQLFGEGSKKLEEEAKKSAAEEAKKAEERRAQMMARFSRGRRGRGGRGSRGGSSGSGKMAVMDVATGKVEVVDKTKSFRLIKDSAILAYHMKAPEPKKPATKADGKAGAGKTTAEKATAEKTTAEKPREGRRARAAGGRGTGQRRGTGRRGRGGRRGTGGSGGSRGADSSSSSGGTKLVLRDLATGKETTYEGVSRFQTIADDKWMLLTLNAPTGDKAKGSKVKSGLVAVHLADGKQTRLVDGAATFGGFTTDRHQKKLAFTSNITEKRVADAKKKAAAAKAKAKAEAKKKKAAAAKAKAEVEKKKAAAEKRKGEPEKKAKPAAKSPAKKAPIEKAPEKKAPKKPLRSEIFLWEFNDRAPRKLVNHETKGMPKDFTVQSSGLTFSADGSVLTFSIKGKAKPDLTKILPEEKVVVDIWHWNDGQVQSQQAKRRGSSAPTYSCVWHLDDGRMVVLGDEKISSMRLLTTDGSRGLATDSKPYEKLVTWDGRYSDVYVVNTINGKRTKILSKLRSRTQPSPSGRYVLYFGQDYEWYSIDIETNKQTCLTSGISVSFENVLDDRPQPSSAYGIAGWTKGDKEVLINDRYDIWKIELESGDATCVTDGYGRANKIVLRNSRFDIEGDDDKRDPDDRPYLQETLVLSAKNDVTKERGYYTDSLTGLKRPKKLLMLNRSIGGLTKAKNADRLFFTLSTFAEFPDVWVSDMSLANRRKLTDGCEIQRTVRWGKSETVTWTNGDGVELKGILIKPDGFDPKRKYPMMVYFYERNSDNVHRYTRPSAGTSPNAAYYVSNGYLWFVPDIVYTIGYPGESAEKCIISGIQHLIAKGFVDRKSIGTAGHSWGGYQTAHLVTRTNLFAAAESGAPVSNMFSAYGGIRYQSGMSRQFQYERTQSRIGGTPWQYPQRYWQNSPIFYADRVATPVLILHNDQDGAVPWTNGLEFFMALRRLGKEAYLFNYNGEPHGLRKKANKADWTRRMAEFFDHHLKGKPTPSWMADGVKYKDRDREKIQYARSFLERQRRAKASGTSGSNQGAR